MSGLDQLWLEGLVILLRAAVTRAALFSIAAVVLGCGERSHMVAPEVWSAAAGTSFRKDKDAAAARGPIVRRSSALARGIHVARTITPEGGTLSIPEAGLTVIFPRGAVSSNILVTATAHRGKHVLYSFEPHGAVFARPITIAQDVGSLQLTKAPVLSDIFGGYLAAGLSDVDARGTGMFSETFTVRYLSSGKDIFVAFSTTHFSGYALASGRAQIKVGE